MSPLWNDMSAYIVVAKKIHVAHISYGHTSCRPEGRVF